MHNYKTRTKYKSRRILWKNGLAGILFLTFLLFTAPIICIHAEEQGQWAYDEDKNVYFYTDEQGFKYSLNEQEDESCVLSSIPKDMKGKIEIPSKITIEGKVRKLHHLDTDTLRIPKGVTKVTFGEGIYCGSDSIFDQCNPDLVVSGCLEDTVDSILMLAKNKGLKMEYQNGYTDKNGILYYAGQPIEDDGTKGKKTGIVYSYDGKAENITVESKISVQGVTYPVTVIGKGAFEYTKVKKVTLPDTITTVEFSAFQGCKSLTSVKLSKKLTDLGHSVFTDCTSLTSIEIPSGVTRLSTSAFTNCKKLKKVTLSKNMKSIGDYVFSSCENLAVIKNLDKVEDIGSETFSYCKKLTSLTFGKKLGCIGSGAFYGCASLKSVTIQSPSMEYIGEMAFYGAKKLKNLTIKTLNLTSENLGKDALKGTGKKMVVKVPAKKVNEYKKLLKKYGNTTIVVKKL